MLNNLDYNIEGDLGIKIAGRAGRQQAGILSKLSDANSEESEDPRDERTGFRHCGIEV